MVGERFGRLLEASVEHRMDHLPLYVIVYSPSGAVGMPNLVADNIPKLSLAGSLKC
jgi:hypothetical protein